MRVCTFTCFYCDQEGHIKRNCPKYKTKMNGQSSKIARTTVMTVDKSHVLIPALADKKLDWIFDSGSAYHLCEDREMFSTYATCDGRLVWMANNTPSRVVVK